MLNGIDVVIAIMAKFRCLPLDVHNTGPLLFVWFLVTIEVARGVNFFSLLVEFQIFVIRPDSVVSPFVAKELAPLLLHFNCMRTFLPSRAIKVGPPRLALGRFK